jgi:hypothetical protein
MTTTLTYKPGAAANDAVAQPTSPCGPAPCGAADTKALERTRFFPRQLVGPDDLTQDQIYFREKARRHNRLLHGWGVVCGACVGQGKTACDVVVQPGYILGPFGDEIMITSCVSLDICKLGATESLGCCGDQLDPWCGDAARDCSAGTKYLAVRYTECPTRPVRAMSGYCGCGCDDAACEYSRIRDSYAFKVLDALPATYPTPFVASSEFDMDPCGSTGNGRQCPPCPDSPWVVLADLTIDSKCNVTAIDCFAHRRYVVSYANMFLTCVPAPGHK